MIGKIKNKWLRRMALCSTAFFIYPLFIFLNACKGIAEEMPGVHIMFKDVWERSDSDDDERHGYP